MALHRDVVAVDDVPVADREDRLTALFASPGGIRGAAFARSPTRARATTLATSPEHQRADVPPVDRAPRLPWSDFASVTAAACARTASTCDSWRFARKGGHVSCAAIASGTWTARAARHRRDEWRTGARGDHATCRGLRSLLQVSFAHVAELPVRVPVRLWEWYWVHDVPERDRYVEGEATYDDFRRYTTDVGVPVVK